MSSLYWLIAALLLGAVEAVFPAGIFLFFAIGALAASLLALAVGTITWQVLCFAVTALLSLVLLRQRWRRLFSGKLVPAGESPAHPLEGQRGTVRETVSSAQPGVVEVGGSFWRAVVDAGEAPLMAGASVVVRGALPQDGLILRVAGSGEQPAAADAFSGEAKSN